MDTRRSDSFYAGVVIVETLLETLGRDTLWTAEGGVREGLVADFERSPPRCPGAPDL
jgi:exopolyphosphatase/pppGpp-phosphohydrolase